MTRLPFPSVAAVNGAAVGAGVTVALLCDLVVMADDAFFSDPRVSLGLLDGAGGLLLWPLLTSLSAAREHLLLGDRVTAAEAHRLGLANRVVAAASAGGGDAGWHRLARLPGQAVRQARRLLNSRSSRPAAILPTAPRPRASSSTPPEHRALVERSSARVARGRARTAVMADGRGSPSSPAAPGASDGAITERLAAGMPVAAAYARDADAGARARHAAQQRGRRSACTRPM